MNKKPIIIVAIVLAAVLVISAVGFILYQNLKPNPLGDISKAEIILQTSERHSDADIMNAVRLVKEQFRTYYGGCTLKKLYYDDEMSLSEEKLDAEILNGTDAIILGSDFHVGNISPDVSFNANEDHVGWKWIIIKDNDGNWELKDWGYG